MKDEYVLQFIDQQIELEDQYYANSEGGLRRYAVHRTAAINALEALRRRLIKVMIGKEKHETAV